MAGRNLLPGGLRSLLLYIILVGLPLAGVTGILYWGERLEAPASVKGSWQADIDGQAADPRDCAAGLRGALALTIAQSGPDLRLTFNDAAQTTMAGQVTGLLVAAREASGSLVLEGTLDRLDGATQLSGTLTVSACDQPLKWSATRLPAAE